jgi:putative ABC transport system permease protein
VAYTDNRALQQQIDQYLKLFWVFIGSMLVLGRAPEFTVIYVTMMVNRTDRATEIATFRTAGVPDTKLIQKPDDIA